VDAKEKVARQRLSLLELAEGLNNVSEACRQRRMDRGQFYEYKRRFQTRGLEGLKDRPPVHKTHPMTTPPEVVDKVPALSLEHPGWGCTLLPDMLKLQGVSISSPTVQNILIKHGMGSKFDRLAVPAKRRRPASVGLAAKDQPHAIASWLFRRPTSTPAPRTARCGCRRAPLRPRQ